PLASRTRDVCGWYAGASAAGAAEGSTAIPTESMERPPPSAEDAAPCGPSTGCDGGGRPAMQQQSILPPVLPRMRQDARREPIAAGAPKERTNRKRTARRLRSERRSRLCLESARSVAGRSLSARMKRLQKCDQGRGLRWIQILSICGHVAATLQDLPHELVPGQPDGDRVECRSELDDNVDQRVAVVALLRFVVML